MPLPVLRHLGASVLLALPLCAVAAPAPADDRLYQQLGAQPGVAALVDDFVQRLLADTRMKPFFADADLPQLRKGLAAQFCQVAGGPCVYDGPDMKKAHSGLDIDRAAFNALVEVLQQTLDARGLPFTVQNRLLATLAPLHREIVNVP
ncbi:group 1 truncated hemoglobin [Ideonella sp.]|uniref:group I truncated hemoglobin n=1 Tax=Ideonella sp. TaxID=1929293 RepID=UPI0035B15588